MADETNQINPPETPDETTSSEIPEEPTRKKYHAPRAIIFAGAVIDAGSEIETDPANVVDLLAAGQLEEVQ